MLSPSKRQCLYVILVDIKKAFDSVKREKLLEIYEMRKICATAENAALLRMLLGPSRIYLGREHQGFRVNTGVP